MKLTLSLNSSAVEKLSPFLKYKFPAISLSAELVHIPFEKEKIENFWNKEKKWSDAIFLGRAQRA